MRIYYSDTFVLPLPEGHRFPMSKYSLLRQRVEQAGLGILATPPPASDNDLLRVHTPEYLARVVNGTLSEKEQRRIGFPWSPGMVERSRRSVGGTIAACRAALSEGIAVNLAGGTHHAYSDHGEGYCVFNDAAVAARALQAEGLARRILLIDLDVHQGNGSASIFANDPSVFTFSMHGEKNFPFHKETGDMDIALPDAAGDAAYLEILRSSLPIAMFLAQADLAIYLAGSDPYIDDKLGRMALTKAGLAERDRFTLEACLSADLPVAIVMAGGYARQVSDTIELHYQTIELAARLHAELNPPKEAV